RIYRGLLDEDSSRAENGFAFYLEEASLVTLGICYEKNGKFAGGAYNPFVRTFVVARINPLRWIQGEPPPLEEVLKTMRDRAARFNVDKIKQSDLANAGGAADDSD